MTVPDAAASRPNLQDIARLIVRFLLLSERFSFAFGQEKERLSARPQGRNSQSAAWVSEGVSVVYV